MQCFKPRMIFLLVAGLMVVQTALSQSESGSIDAASGSGELQGDNITARTKSPVKLLLMLPLTTREYNNSNMWDRGHEMLPGAELAVEEINNSSALLSDCKLELAVTNIEHCTQDQFASNVQALVPFADIASNPESNVLGMVGGPFCPHLLLRLVSPLASRNRSRLFQISGSTSAIVRNHGVRVDLNFITPSIELYYETVYAMMRQFGWSKIFIIAKHFFQGATTVPGSMGLDVTFRQFYSTSLSLFNDLRLSQKNIVFASIGARDAVDVLCQAQNQSLVYPNYVWIFHDLSPVALRQSNSGGRKPRCDAKTLDVALEGTFFLQFPFRPKSPNVTLISGLLYSEYYSEYVSRLLGNLRPNLYSNVLYDSVWGFALALNRSLSSVGQSFRDYLTLNGRQSLVELMDVVLPGISFQGASGTTNFSKNASTGVAEVFLHKDNSTTLVGVYQASSNIFSQALAVSVPNDTLPHKYTLIPKPLSAILAVVIITCLIVTTIVLALFFHYREDPDIKATSPHLSYLIFLGCYLLFASTLLHVIRGALVVTGTGALVICGAIITGDSLGVNLIFTTLLLRMLRIYRIFSLFGKTGKLWSNRNMACIVGVVVLADIVLILTWSLADTFRIVDVITFQPDTYPPHYEVKQFCHSNHSYVWLGIVLGKLGVLFAVVLFLAIKTRKIRRSNFKDTKKVNIYIFSTIMIVITHMTLYFLFKSTNNTIAAHMMLYLAFGITGLLCQLFLFVPKVVSPILKKYGYEVAYDKDKRRKTLTKKIEPTKSARAIAMSMTNFTELI